MKYACFLNEKVAAVGVQIKRTSQHSCVPIADALTGEVTDVFHLLNSQAQFNTAS